MDTKKLFVNRIYYGVKGWLLFFCLLLAVINPVMWISTFFQKFHTHVYMFGYWTEIILSSLFVLLGFIIGILLFLRKTIGVKLINIYLLFSLLLSSSKMIYSYLHEQRDWKFLVIVSLQSILYCSIIFFYFKYSKRVKSTYNIS